MEKTKKKVIIVGAGISGMTCGIYLSDNGFDVTIYEKHSIPGGECTGWMREGVFIDGCAHWIVGTNKNSVLYPLWHHIGAFDETTKIYDTEYFKKIDIDGKIYTFWADLDKLKSEMLAISPEDKKHINEFIKGVKAYQHVTIPTKKPLDMMNLFELTGMGLHLLPMAGAYAKYTHIKIKDWTSKLKSPTLKKFIDSILSPDLNMHSLLYVMQALSLRDAGMVEGGSLKLALRVADRCKKSGCKMMLNSPVEKIIVNDGVAKGIRLEGDKEEYADYVIAACDAHFALYNLLDDKYTKHYYKKRFEDYENHPLFQTMQVSFKVMKDISSQPKMLEFSIDPIKIGNCTISKIALRSHAFDKTLNKNATSITVLVDCDDEAYKHLKNLSKEEYNKEKLRIGNEVLNRIKDYTKFTDEDIKLIDVTSPLTYERYCNAYHGSYMSFVTTHMMDKLMDDGKLDGLKNFYLTGQWIMSPGGLPIALFTGKNTAYRVTKAAKQKWINKEKED